MLHIGRNIASLIFSRVIAGIILFLIYTRLVQYLGPEAAGQYGLLASYITVFSFFIDLGMSQLVIKKMSEDQTHVGKYLSNYFLVQLCLGIIFMLIMDAFVFFADYPQLVKSMLYMGSVGLLLSSLSLPFRGVINAFQRLTVIAKVNFFNSAINAGLMVLAIIFRKNIFFLSFIVVSISAFDFLLYSFLVNKYYTKFKFEFDKAFIKQLWILTFPFTLLTLFSVYNRVDGLLLPHLRSFTENGYYAVAYKFWDTLAFLPGVIGISLYPYFAQQLSRGAIENVKIALEVYTRYMIALGVPLSVGAFLLSQEITLSFYGPKFLPAAPALWLLVLAVSLLFIYSPANSLMISQLTKTATKITGITLVLNIILNLILIPRYGFVAAAAVTVLSELIQTVGYAIAINRKIVRYKFWSFFVKPFIAAAIMAAVILLLKDFNVWLIIGLGGLIYSITLLLFRFFHKTDWDLLKAAVNLRKDIKAE